MSRGGPIIVGTTPDGRLFIVATPIGNLGDITHRALATLGAVDVLACEDTRRTRTIYEHYSLPRPGTILSYHEHNEEQAGERILALLRQGRTVALCSDSGTPGISDPGYRIVSAAVEAGITVEMLPGASAVDMALVLSGLPTSTYTFKGFPPRQPGKRASFLAAEKDAPHTLVFYESPFRVGVLLRDALTAYGDRRAAVCLELTKKFEKVSRGYLADLAAEYGGQPVKGEVTVVIAGNHPKFVRGTQASQAIADDTDDADRSGKIYHEAHEDVIRNPTSTSCSS